jgi:hypothetical protein
MTGCGCHDLWIHGAGKDVKSELFADVVEGLARSTAFLPTLCIVVEKVAQVFFHFVEVATHKKHLHAYDAGRQYNNSALPMSKAQCPLRQIGEVLSEDN